MIDGSNKIICHKLSQQDGSNSWDGACMVMHSDQSGAGGGGAVTYLFC